MTYMSGGFLREDDGALATEAFASQSAYTHNGLSQATSNNRVITNLAAFGGRSNGWATTTAGSGVLACVAYASLVGPTTTEHGILVDANGKVVTVTRALAVAPLRYSGGFQRDANGALVVT